MDRFVLIRDFRANDSIPEITALLHSAYAALACMGFRYTASHQDDATTLRRLQRGFPLVAELDGVIVATVTLNLPPAKSHCSWYLQPGVYSFGQFAVRPDLQRRGIGLRLVQYIEERARKCGAKELALDTAEGAAHLRSWYERLGFRLSTMSRGLIPTIEAWSSRSSLGNARIQHLQVSPNNPRWIHGCPTTQHCFARNLLIICRTTADPT